jgi:hypothetical protein
MARIRYMGLGTRCYIETSLTVHTVVIVLCARMYVSSVEDEKTKETMDILWVGWCSTVQQSGVALSSNQ